MKCLVFVLLLSFSKAGAQDGGLWVSTYKGRDTTKPLLFYISGDGGLDNSFSTAFMQRFQALGYSLLGMNSKSYFWTKKTPQQAANDISNTLTRYLKAWNCKSFILIGYSFGADVVPFVQRRLSSGLIPLTRHVVLLSPSAKTDFEIHLLDMIGLGSSKGLSVPGEINKLIKPTTIIFGKSESTFALDSIKAPNVQIVKIPGGHHYDRDANEVVRQITNAIQ